MKSLFQMWNFCFYSCVNPELWWLHAPSPIMYTFYHVHYVSWDLQELTPNCYPIPCSSATNSEMTDVIESIECFLLCWVVCWKKNCVIYDVLAYRLLHLYQAILHKNIQVDRPINAWYADKYSRYKIDHSQPQKMRNFVETFSHRQSCGLIYWSGWGMVILDSLILLCINAWKRRRNQAGDWVVLAWQQPRGWSCPLPAPLSLPLHHLSSDWWSSLWMYYT